MEMTSLKTDEAKARRATLLERKITQADEGRLAMADYVREQAATLDRTAKLKALRLAKDSDPKRIIIEPTKQKVVRKNRRA
jgi:hypothetical protein